MNYEPKTDVQNLWYLNDAHQVAIAIADLFPEYPTEARFMLEHVGLRFEYFAPEQAKDRECSEGCGALLEHDEPNGPCCECWQKGKQ